MAMVEFLKIERASKEDFVVTISSSGNSPNIISVLNYCKGNNINTLALSGLKDDNKSISLADYSIYVPMKTYGMVECIHQIFLHLMLDESMGIEEWERNEFQNMNSNNFKL
jgi:D-sedoheptulose 7-phosphate isomerase